MFGFFGDTVLFFEELRGFWTAAFAAACLVPAFEVTACLIPAFEVAASILVTFGIGCMAGSAVFFYLLSL